MKHHRVGRIVTSVPFLMIAGLTLGTISSIAHHIFYTKVNGQVVQSSVQQEWYSRIGVGLANLVKMCLTAAAGFAYIQLLWYTMRKKAFTLGCSRCELCY